MRYIKKTRVGESIGQEQKLFYEEDRMLDQKREGQRKMEKLICNANLMNFFAFVCFHVSHERSSAPGSGRRTRSPLTSMEARTFVEPTRSKE